MTQFSRRAKWLNTLFPASVLPQTGDPGSVSDDVSLVQQYDGGGVGIPSRPEWFFGADSPIGAAGDVELVTMGDDEYLRLYSVHAFTIVLANCQCAPSVIDLQSVPNGVCQLAPLILTLGIGLGSVVFALNQSIIGPGMSLRMSHFGGGGATSLRYRAYGLRLPVGAVCPF